MPEVTCRTLRLRPLASATQMCALVSVASSITNAIQVPLGDQAGCVTSNAGLTTTAAAPPPRGTRRISTPSSKARELPLGAQVGPSPAQLLPSDSLHERDEIVPPG